MSATPQPFLGGRREPRGFSAPSIVVHLLWNILLHRFCDAIVLGWGYTLSVTSYDINMLNNILCPRPIHNVVRTLGGN